jgi:AraC-like DNA-binding protein
MGPDDIAIGSASGGRGPRAPGFATPWRSLPWMVIQAVESGRYRIDHPAGSDALGPGTVWFVPPGCRHRHAVVGTAPVITTHIHLTIHLFGAIDARAALGAPRLFPDAWAGPLGRALRATADHPGDGLAGALARQAQLATLAAALVRQLPELAAAGPALGALGPALRFADLNLHLPLTRTELAARAGLAPSRFHEVFLAATGLPPMAWVRRRRLARAAELLAGSDLGMAAIAERSGFCDAYHLNKRFRAAYGVPPTTFRRDARG